SSLSSPADAPGTTSASTAREAADHLSIVFMESSAYFSSMSKVCLPATTVYVSPEVLGSAYAFGMATNLGASFGGSLASFGGVLASFGGVLASFGGGGAFTDSVSIVTRYSPTGTSFTA